MATSGSGEPKTSEGTFPEPTYQHGPAAAELGSPALNISHAPDPTVPSKDPKGPAPAPDADAKAQENVAEHFSTWYQGSRRALLEATGEQLLHVIGM